MAEFVTVDVEAGVGTIRLDRPPMNALNAQVQEELNHHSDLNLGYKLGAATTLNLVVLNLADRKPSWDSSFAFFDFTQADPRGRFASVKLTHRF